MTKQIYTPIVKGKLNDLMALGKLSTATRNLIKPMIEVMPIDKKSSMDNHLFKIADYIIKHVPLGDIYLDFYGLKADSKASTGEPAILAGYNLLKMMGRVVTPTYGFHRDDSIWPAFKDICKLFNQGFCFRIDIDDIDDAYQSEETWSQILEKSSTIGLMPSNIDLMIDLRDVRIKDEKELNEIHEKVIDFLSITPKYNHYRSIIVAGSSAMKTLSDKPAIPKDGIGSVTRNELKIWAKLQQDVPESIVLIFGDYGVIHPDFSDQSPKGFKNTNAKIRYTNGNKIDYYRGHCLRNPVIDYGQYHELASQITSSKSYCKKEFSFGDKYIHLVAEWNELPKSSDPWILADMNHHVEYTTLQMQRFIEEAKTSENILNLIETYS